MINWGWLCVWEGWVILETIDATAKGKANMWLTFLSNWWSLSNESKKFTAVFAQRLGIPCLVPYHVHLDVWESLRLHGQHIRPPKTWSCSHESVIKLCKQLMQSSVLKKKSCPRSHRSIFWVVYFPTKTTSITEFLFVLSDWTVDGTAEQQDWANWWWKLGQLGASWLWGVR